jgi:hypothetical protein
MNGARLYGGIENLSTRMTDFIKQRVRASALRDRRNTRDCRPACVKHAC